MAVSGLEAPTSVFLEFLPHLNLLDDGLGL